MSRTPGLGWVVDQNSEPVVPRRQDVANSRQGDHSKNRKIERNSGLN